MTITQSKNDLLALLLGVLTYRKNEKEFWANHKILQDKVHTAIECFYTYIEANNYASEDKNVYFKLNQHPTFWNITRYSLQSGFFMTLGKIFDDGPDTLSIHKLLSDCVEHTEYFSKQALASRKVAEGIMSQSDAQQYVKSKYEPTAKDLRLFKKCLSPYRKNFESVYKQIRNLIFGHIILKDKADISELFSKTNVGEIDRMLHFLYDLLDNIWYLYQNGQKPSLGSRKYNYKKRIKDDTRGFIDTIIKA